MTSPMIIPDHLTASIIRNSRTPPSPVYLSKNPSKILDFLKIQIGASKNANELKYPIIIGSRAAAFWLPSFRPFGSWDLIATAQQAFDIVQDLKTHNKHDLSLSFSYQPLTKEVIQRKSITPELQKKMNELPFFICQVSGEVKDGFKFNIEIVPTMEKQPDGGISTMLESSSARQLFTLCHSSANKNGVAYLDFPVSPEKEHPCIVAPVEVLEAIKCSHIKWPDNFEKNISDIHTFRSVMKMNTSDNMGLHANVNEPLTSPKRSIEMDNFLHTRNLESEAYRGTPVVTPDEDCFIRDTDKLTPGSHIPFDLIQYGDTPVYDSLKAGLSSVISRKRFEGSSYDLQLKCIKEEVMYIALEKFLVPDLTNDFLLAYKAALTHICTKLTSGWFHQFVVDNYPRLVVCDKPLLSIRDNILKVYSVPQTQPIIEEKQMNTLKETISDLNDLFNVQKLIPLTKSIDWKKIREVVEKDRVKKRHALMGEDSSDSDTSSDCSDKNKENTSMHVDKYDSGEEGYTSHEEEYTTDEEDLDGEEIPEEVGLTKKKFWTIDSLNKENPPLLVSFINEFSLCENRGMYCATISVQPFNAFSDIRLSHLRGYGYIQSEMCVFQLRKHTFQKISIFAKAGVDSPSVNLKNSEAIIKSQSLKNDAKLIGLEDLDEELLMKYIISLAQPKLRVFADCVLEQTVNGHKSAGLIPLVPKNHTWFDLWKFNLKN